MPLSGLLDGVGVIAPIRAGAVASDAPAAAETVRVWAELKVLSIGRAFDGAQIASPVVQA